jgi:hypothetical protein
MARSLNQTVIPYQAFYPSEGSWEKRNTRRAFGIAWESVTAGS